MHETHDDELRSDLPPLHALQAFEAAARLGSLTKAAGERHLTPSAISRAVSLVEHWSGVPLFRRQGPRITLTPAGHALRDRISGPLQSLHSALQGSTRTSARTKRLDLGVMTLPSFAQGWLVPRLHDFGEQFPQVDLRLHLSYAVESLPPLEPRVALRFGAFDKLGLHAERMWRDPLVLVAAPGWTHRHGAAPAAWPGSSMLRMTGFPWPRRIGPHRLAVASGLEANDAMVLAEAARLGLGVACLRRSLVEDAIRRGSLQDLSPEIDFPGDTALWLVCREEMRDHPAVSTFWQWAMEQAAHDPLRSDATS